MIKNKTIIYSPSHNIWGGGQIYIEQLCNYMNDRGIETYVLTSEPQTFSCPSKKMENVLSKKKRLFSAIGIAKQYKKEGFKNIILNVQSTKEEKYLALEKGEELLCPIFTTLGNHDFRIAAYDLNWGGMYKKIGLNAFEAIALNEAFSASPIDAITKSIAALKGYWSEINPSLDFSMNLGNNIFIFLNSGPDSFSNLRDLAAGKPSVTGLSSRQITYLENIINTDFYSCQWQRIRGTNGFY